MKLHFAVAAVVAVGLCSRQGFSQESSAISADVAACNPADSDQKGAANDPAKCPPKTVAEAVPETNNSAHGLFGALRIGPTVSLAFPHLVNYSVDATYGKLIGISFGGGRLGYAFDEKSEVEIRNWDLRARWFPFLGSFFLGAAYGTQGIVGKTSQDLKMKQGELELAIPTDMRLDVTTNYLTPHLGWFATWDSGFTLGFEVGYQMAMNSSAKFNAVFQNVSAASRSSVENSDEYKKAKEDVEVMAETFGKVSIPYVNLLRMGWLL